MPIFSFRMDALTVDPGGSEAHPHGNNSSLRNVAKRATHLSLPGMGASDTRSLFIFSHENFIRKYAKLIIEWGYPFIDRKNNQNSVVKCLTCYKHE